MWSLGGNNPGGKIQLLLVISGGTIEQENRPQQQNFLAFSQLVLPVFSILVLYFFVVAVPSIPR